MPPTVPRPSAAAVQYGASLSRQARCRNLIPYFVLVRFSNFAPRASNALA
jgi:hypothetical protein